MVARLLAPLLLVAALLAAAPSARAADCNSITLTDAAGTTYAMNEFAEANVANADAFNTTGNLYFDHENTSGYREVGGDDCTTEDGGREVVFPPRTYGALEVGAKIWVPQGSPAVVRELWSVKNVSDAPVTRRVYRYAQAEYATREVVATSSGDDVGTAADHWLTWTNGGDAADPTVAYVWQGAENRRQSSDQVFQDCCTAAEKFDPVVDSGSENDVNARDTLQLAPGETKILMHAVAIRASDAEAASTAAELAAAPDYLFASMTAGEVRAVHNFLGRDADADGVANDADNCADDPNPGQENLDGDAEGDVCDADDDADGLPDDAETAFGTDARRADTDGDGRADRDDACPKTPASGADGCPVLPPVGPTITQVIGRVDPGSTAATLTPARDRRLPYRFTARGAVLPPSGLSAQQACASPGFVRMQVRRGRRVIASRRARLRPDCTFVVGVRFANRRRTGTGLRSLRFTVVWQGNRFLEPATIGTFTRQVG